MSSLQISARSRQVAKELSDHYPVELCHLVDDLGGPGGTVAVCPGYGDWLESWMLSLRPMRSLGRSSLFMVGCTKLKSDPYSMRQNRCTRILGSLE